MRIAVAFALCAGCFDYEALSRGLVDGGVVDATEIADADLSGSGGQVKFHQPQPVDASSTTDLASADLTSFPSSCAGLTDGAHTLYVGDNSSKPWPAECAAGKEYLVLVHTSVNENFSQYTAGGTSPGTDVRTRYSKLRVDPVTLLVDTSDQRFSTSSGALSQGGTDPVNSMPYAVAMNCGAGADGLGNVDLRGTPFHVEQVNFILGGYLPHGSATLSSAGQVVDLLGGGGCGWMSGGVYNTGNGGSPYNGAGGFRLQLVY